MGFFDPPPPPPEPPAQPPQPPWLGPPDNVLGVAVPLELLVVRTEDVAVVVHNVVAYPNGVHFVLDVRRRRAEMWADPIGMHAGLRGIPEERENAMRFGVGFADGSKATVDGARPWAQGDDAHGPVLISRGGGGGGTRWETGYWLWPLPPEGPLTFVAEWPGEGIGETRVEVDAGLLREAASRSEKLWHENPGPSGGTMTTRAVGFSIGQAKPPESD